MQMIAAVLCLLVAVSHAAANPSLVGRSLLQANPNFTTPDTISVYVAAGDVTTQSAVLWVRCPEAAAVTFSVMPGSKEYMSMATAASDFTTKVVLQGLSAATKYTYEATCDANGKVLKSTTGKFVTAPKPTDAADVTFAWVADIAGQGWGINKDITLKLASEQPFNGDVVPGGFFFAETITRLAPDFVVWAGDTIYADGKIAAVQELNITKNKGAVLVEQVKWKNTYIKDFQAVTLQEFRQNWLYNLFDVYYPKLLASTASWFEWDDHEVTNNWWPGEPNSRPGVDADKISPPARQSFYEYTPITPNSPIYRSHQHGKHLEVFNVDLRSYRGRNIDNTNDTLVQMFGAEQYQWLLKSLKASTATWKIIVNDVPLGYNVGDGPGSWESFSNNDTRLLGREYQTRALLQFVKQEGIKNVHFITADVHYTAAIEYSPERATGGFKDYTPFYEIVIGPCHAGSFDNPPLDMTFGPQHLFLRTPSTEGYDQNNLPPPYTTSFGYGSVSKNGDLTFQVRDVTGSTLWSKTFNPAN